MWSLERRGAFLKLRPGSEDRATKLVEVKEISSWQGFLFSDILKGQANDVVESIAKVLSPEICL
jgi:hypothetical protein